MHVTKAKLKAGRLGHVNRKGSAADFAHLLPRTPAQRNALSEMVQMLERRQAERLAERVLAVGRKTGL
ncbi:MAG: hypothetical protein ACM33T_06325 [Solirubrobacterales bacterium]